MSPEDLELFYLAQEDIARYWAYGVSLNPFSTHGARHDWEQGFKGLDNMGRICRRGMFCAAIMARRHPK